MRVAANRINISNNQFISCFFGGVCLTGATDTQITGNTFYSIGSRVPVANYNGVVLTDCAQTIIANNRFTNPNNAEYSQYGVQEKGTTDSTLIMGNSFQNMVLAAYYLIGSNSRAINNMIDNTFETLPVWSGGAY